MSCFLFANDEETNKKVNIDDLYERDHQRDLKQLSIFNKILNRVHRRITLTSKNKTADKHIWFTVPEYIFGEPIYSKGECIGYLVANLEKNGFHVKYIYPNSLFVSWIHWVPSYVRSEFKKKTGMIIDEKGNVVANVAEKEEDEKAKQVDSNKKMFTPIQNYKPSGNLIYNQEMFEKMEEKIQGSIEKKR